MVQGPRRRHEPGMGKEPERDIVMRGLGAWEHGREQEHGGAGAWERTGSR